MKTSLLSFIALIAVIVHATPTIPNVSTLSTHPMYHYYHDGRLTLYRWQDRMESFQAGDSLDKRSANFPNVCPPFIALCQLPN